MVNAEFYIDIPEPNQTTAFCQSRRLQFRRGTKMDNDTTTSKTFLTLRYLQAWYRGERAKPCKGPAFKNL